MDASLWTVVPPPDRLAEPEGFVVVLEPRDRIHFLDWGGPDGGPEARLGSLLVHGIGGTAWEWTPVARRLRSIGRVVAMDLRGHGLSDAPIAGYELEQLAEDAIAVAEGSGLLPFALGDDQEVIGADHPGIVIAGHGFGAMVAAWTAAMIGRRCAGLVLVDGGWADLRETTGMEPDEWLRGLDEPPEVLRSMEAFLADREGFDPATWDADQERAARATVTEVPAGHLLPAIRPHALARTVEAMFAYRPSVILPSVEAPIVALMAADDEEGSRARALAIAQASLVSAGRPPIREERYPGIGHNLMRYRPVQVTTAILTVAGRPA